jgi:hypothetical protein
MLASIENMLLTILGNIDNNNMAHIATIYKNYNLNNYFCTNALGEKVYVILALAHVH